eukprot:gb/GECH01011867.1/.p1 GENE.gb/GECH01011867.1/~~gb/GECH01011867.1/.p1  ORF type:complete len:522 (+),score=107.98 gb/GECH01011867.1/:1-1566(+)
MSETGFKSLKTKDTVKKEGVGGAHHSWTNEERAAYVDHINAVLMHQGVKINREDDSLFEEIKESILLCDLVNATVPETIEERAINRTKLNTFRRIENYELALNSARSIGCSLVNIGPSDLSEGRHHIVMGLLWQLIRIGLLSQISLKEVPELVAMAREDEELSDLTALPSEELLLRWVNYHLERHGERPINNFTTDIKDGRVYTVLLSSIAPNGECDMSPLDEPDVDKRLEKLMEGAEKIGCRRFVTPKDIKDGHPRLNLAFLAHMFNTHPGLEEVKEEMEVPDVEEEVEEGTREERAFTRWAQSKGVNLRTIPDDIIDGLLILKLMDMLKPGVVDWKQVVMKPKMKFHRLENCNYVVDCANRMGLQTVNVGGSDIEEGNKKLTLGILWQLMRYEVLQMLSSLSGTGSKVTEDEVLAWANDKLENVSVHISSFRDPVLKAGTPLLRLCNVVHPGAVPPETIDEDDPEGNAKLAISIAWKIGATVFMVWEDIVEAKSRFLMMYFASIWAAERRHSSQPEQQT